MPQIKDVLLESNAWWKGAFKPEYHERDVYRQMKKYFPLPQIIALVGLRRVGKTTLMQKAASDFIGNGFGARNVVYFSFDEFHDVEARDIIKEYEALMEKSVREGHYLLLLDEVQKIPDWEEQIKRLYDTYGKNIKIFISGSESLFIRKKSKETLAGRIFEFRVNPLSFKEFLGFVGAPYQPIGLYEKELLRRFGEYTLCMGFPELIGIKDREIILKYVKESIIEKVVYRDIPRLFKVRDVETLEALLRIFLDEPGQLVDLSELAGALRVSRQTVSRYLAYLEKSFLIRKLYNYSRNRRKVERKLKKYYPSMLTDLIFKDDDTSRSKVLEWLAVSATDAEFFWRDPYKNEVDIIFAGKTAGKKPVPVEVKYGKIDTRGLVAFMRNFNIPNGYIASYDREEKMRSDGKNIRVIPAFKFLLQYDKFLDTCSTTLDDGGGEVDD